MPEQEKQEEQLTETGRGLNRRQFLPRAAGALAALGVGGVGGYELRDHTADAEPSTAGLSTEPATATATSGPAPGSPGSGMLRFVSRPDLLPPAVTINDLETPAQMETSPRFIVVSPVSNVPYKGEQVGPMIFDRRGRLIWFNPLGGSTFDFNIQTYKGAPALTWWHGKVVDGHGVGTANVVDSTYKTIATFSGSASRPIDLHEFNMTAQGTALLSSYETTNGDLGALGGPSSAPVLSGHALEVDLATGKVLMDWSSLDHVPVTESYESTPSDSKAYDYFHINSIAETDDGHLLISGRNTWTVYKVHRTTGEILWRLGGKKSDFTIATDAQFEWQHHVRPHGSRITVFDNANNSGHGSYGLLLNVDQAKKRVTLDQAYQTPAKFVVGTLGSVQLMPNGRVFVGWGVQPFFSEFLADGTMVYLGQYQSATRSYRTFLVDWVGKPTDNPAVVATTNPTGGFLIYVSWNGATEVATWEVLAGTSKGALAAVGSQPWSGFETAIVVDSTGPYFQVVGYDASGKELGRSEVV